MKYRTDFVTNSSSSSFIVMIKKEAYDEAFKKSDDYTKKVLKEIKDEDTLFGMDIILFNIIDTHGEGTFSELYDQAENDEDPYSAFHDFLNTIPKSDKKEFRNDF